MVADGQDVSVKGVLLGATVRYVGRAVDMGIIEFVNSREEVVKFHIQCPFRILQESDLILGSRDMRYAQPGAGERAFDNFEMIYDERAEKLNVLFSRFLPTVTRLTTSAGGSVTVEWDPKFRVEIFPDCSGAIEAWRVFVKGGRHFGFPQSLI